MLISGAINTLGPSGTGAVGSAYVYHSTPVGQWNQEADLTPSDGGNNDSFGASVGIYEDSAVVGATRHRQLGSGEGAAYVFQRSSGGDWQELDEFPAPVGGFHFGVDVAIDGSHAVFSGSFNVDLGPGPDGVRGAVEVLKKVGPSSWTHSQEIDLPRQQSFVTDVALDDNTLAIGNWQLAIPNGEKSYGVEIYEDSTTGFVRSATVLPSTNPAGTYFGWSVALDHERMLVGAPGDSQHGAAYVFERDASGNWVQTARLVSDDIDQRHLFGSEVALCGDLAIVNSWTGSSGLIDGAVYVFQRRNTGDWMEIAKLYEPPGSNTFGYSVATVNEQVFVGGEVNTPGVIHVFSQVPEPPTFLSFLVISVVRFTQRKER